MRSLRVFSSVFFSRSLSETFPDHVLDGHKSVGFIMMLVVRARATLIGILTERCLGLRFPFLVRLLRFVYFRCRILFFDGFGHELLAFGRISPFERCEARRGLPDFSFIAYRFRCFTKVLRARECASRYFLLVV
jgi:hypothetical protein